MTSSDFIEEVLPDFTPDDVLPPKDYSMTIEQLRDSMLVHGRADVTPDDWDQQWRGILVDNLEILVSQLQQVGIEHV